MTKYLLILVGLLLFACQQTKDTTKQEVVIRSLDLVWSDEFETVGLPDTTKWSYDLGNGCPNICGWGNNELQYYTQSNLKNARVENGHLIIEALKENMEEMKYTSARMVTKNKGDWKYGRIEVKAKLPSGRGTWPAIWMLPTDMAVMYTHLIGMKIEWFGISMTNNTLNLKMKKRQPKNGPLIKSFI